MIDSNDLNQSNQNLLDNCIENVENDNDAEKKSDNQVLPIKNNEEDIELYKDSKENGNLNEDKEMKQTNTNSMNDHEDN